jgi:hypothetical protein
MACCFAGNLSGTLGKVPQNHILIAITVQITRISRKPASIPKAIDLSG